MVIDPHKPKWAMSTNEGTPKVCQKCGSPFRDYTKKQKHTICLGCFKLAYYKNTTIRARPNTIRLKRDKEDHRICSQCDGAGCLDCTNGITDYEPEKELELGME